MSAPLPCPGFTLTVYRLMRTFFSAIVAPLIAMVALTLGFLWLINARDEPLSEDARSLLVYVAPSPAQLKGNGFLILAGLDAPLPEDARFDPSANAIDVGKQRLQREIERHQWYDTHGLAADDALVPPVFKLSAPIPRDEVLPEAVRCPSSHAGHCHQWYEQHSETLRALLAQHQPLLDRMDAAANADSFSNPFPVYLTFSLPPYQLLVTAHELQLAKASLYWSAHDYERALQLLERSDRLTHRLAHGANNLVGSMIAVAMQYRMLRWLSSALKVDGALPQTIARRIQALLEQPAINLRNGIHGEGQLVIHTAGLIGAYAATDWVQNVYFRLVYLPHETMNRQLHQMQLFSPLATAPADQLDTVNGQAQQQWSDAEKKRLRWWGLRNRAGNQMIAMGAPSYIDFIQRAHDVNAYQRMVLLQLHAAEQRIPAHQMAEWLQTSPAEWRNPYTLEPMRWDANTQSLVFEGRASQSQNPDRSRTYRITLQRTP
ncbi:hypothetical protein [Diaphorobacter sp.]|uniref:hypothetical protein n=1 Tax=Diaphorobacter sp. TaxID=1934310 RepID=UPI0028B16916|nr:hypothetical protein [Diaphorobacter sp.]